jgi:transcriptional regulator with XRE-family HTH domain
VRGTSGTPSHPEEPVGLVLARMRREKELTGGQLGRLVGMSQPKISRLENGVGFPDPDDVALIARVLGATDDQIRTLKERAERAHNRMTDWRLDPGSLGGRQRGLGQRESKAQAVRVFQPAVIVGLLQTSEYARAVLAAFHDLTSTDSDGSPGITVSEAVSARVHRQELLMDRNRTFHFLMAEAVLGNRVCPPEDMLAQIRRVREVSQQENVSVRFIPAEAWLEIAPFHGFSLLDDDFVTVDLFNTSLSSHGKADARLYRRVFDSLERHAVTDIEPILDKYVGQYLDLSRPRNRR